MALAALIAFILFVLVGRVLLQLRLTGDHGIRRARRRSPAISKLTSWLFLLDFVGITSLVIMDATSVTPV